MSKTPACGENKLVGFSPKASRFPLIVERVPDGKAFKMPLEAAASLKDKK